MTMTIRMRSPHASTLPYVLGREEGGGDRDPFKKNLSMLCETCRGRLCVMYLLNDRVIHTLGTTRNGMLCAASEFVNSSILRFLEKTSRSTQRSIALHFDHQMIMSQEIPSLTSHSVSQSFVWTQVSTTCGNVWFFNLRGVCVFVQLRRICEAGGGNMVLQVHDDV